MRACLLARPSLSIHFGKDAIRIVKDVHTYCQRRPYVLPNLKIYSFSYLPSGVVMFNFTWEQSPDGMGVQLA